MLNYIHRGFAQKKTFEGLKFRLEKLMKSNKRNPVDKSNFIPSV